MFRSSLFLFAALSLGLAACATDELPTTDDELGSVDQDVTAPPFRLRSAQFTGAVMIPASTSPGSVVQLKNETFSTRERWINVNQQIIHFDTQQCLQPNSFSANASIIMTTCNSGVALQGWSLRKKPNGTVRFQNLATGFYLDAVGVSRTMENRPLDGLLDQDFFRDF